MLQLTREGTLNQLSNERVTAFQNQWKQQHAIILPKVIEPKFLKHLQNAIKRGEFYNVKHSGVDATELTLKRDSTIDLLEMVSSTPTFSNALAKITNSGPIGYFHGRIYNIQKSDHDDWHQDTGYNYMMAMSINLSPKPYQGGSLVLRNKKTKEIYADIHNIGPGDALLFNIDPTLEHKITPVAGKNPKIAFAGWFCPKPTYQNYMSKIIHRVMKKSKFITPTMIANGPAASFKDASTKRLKVSESVAFRLVGTKAFLVNLADNTECILNGMGAKIWRGIVNGESRAQIVKTLQKTYKEETSILETEYLELAQELIHVGVLIEE